jgi:anti-anti-sigma regulatory factor
MRDLVLDLRGVSAMDSSGVMLLVLLDALARRRGLSFWVVGGNPTVERTLRASGADAYIAVLDVGEHGCHAAAVGRRGYAGESAGNGLRPGKGGHH